MNIRNNWFHQMQRGDLPTLPVSGLLGQQILRVDLELCELDADYWAATSFTNPAGKVQGGMLGAMLDDLLSSLVNATLAPGQSVVTLEQKLSCLRPAEAGQICGQARLLKRGRVVYFAAGELSQHGQLVATASATCLVR